MNRDELKTREESGLQNKKRNSVFASFPLDAEAGGTWIGLNSHGVSLALLNRYQAPSIRDAYSRGNIISNAIFEGSSREIISYLKHLDTERYNPFNLLLVDGNKVTKFHWDREKYAWNSHVMTNSMMLTSSSERLEQVSDYRKTKFSQWLDEYSNENPIDQYHLSQAPRRASDSVMMHRTLVHTKSIVQIRVDLHSASLDYFDTRSLKANQRVLGTPSARSELRLEPCSDPVTALE
ncbi:MAG: NRDE family protein [Cellvibrionaceae bacterium]